MQVEDSVKKSTAVDLVFSMLRDIMRKITYVDGIETQQKLALQLFKYLGKVESLEEVAQKMLAVGLAEDKEREDDSDDGEGLMEALYVE